MALWLGNALAILCSLVEPVSGRLKSRQERRDQPSRKMMIQASSLHSPLPNAAY